MPKYLSDHEIPDFKGGGDRKVQLLIECPHTVIDILPTEALAIAANGIPGKAFTITVQLLEAGQSPTGKRRARK